MPEQDPAALVRAAYEAFNAREFDLAAALHSADLELADVATGERLHGRAGYLQRVQGWAAAFPDCLLEVTRLGAAGAVVSAELVARGTHTGTLLGTTGQIPPTGVQMELRLCELSEVRDGRIARVSSYYDAGSLLRQMGLLPGSPLHAPDRRAPLDLYAEIDASALPSEKAVVQRFLEEVVNRRDVALATELCVPNLVWHGGAMGELRDVASYQQLLASFLSSFPDLQVEVQELIAEGDRVVARYTTRATHQGDFLGIPATGRRLAASGTSVYRVFAGRIVEEWWQLDLLGVMQQLDAVPAMVSPGGQLA